MSTSTCTPATGRRSPLPGPSPAARFAQTSARAGEPAGAGARPRGSTLPRVGSWYTIGLCLGLSLGLAVAVTGILGSNVFGIGASAVIGAAVGGAIGLAVGDTAHTVAVLGAVGAGVVVTGALRRGATRFGTGAYLAALGALICLVALIPVAGYALAVAVPVLAFRLRGRQAARFAGLRSLAK